PLCPVPPLVLIVIVAIGEKRAESSHRHRRTILSRKRGLQPLLCNPAGRNSRKETDGTGWIEAGEQSPCLRGNVLDRSVTLKSLHIPRQPKGLTDLNCFNAHHLAQR